MPPTHLIPLRARNTAVSDASPTNALHHSSACPHHLPSRDSIFPIVSPNFGETRRDVRCRPRGNSSSNLYLRFAASSVIFHFCHPEEAKSLACERLPTKDLCVVAQEVVPIQTSPADGRSVIETSMRPVPVVLVQPGGKLGGAKPRVVIGASISPLPQRGLDKAFRLAVGARGVGAGGALGGGGPGDSAGEG